MIEFNEFGLVREILNRRVEMQNLIIFFSRLSRQITSLIKKPNEISVSTLQVVHDRV